MQQFIQAIAGLLTGNNIAAAKAAPAVAADGVDISTWKKGASGIYYPAAEVIIDGDGAGSLTGPVLVCGLDPYTNVWHRFAQLNGGVTINLTATLGYTERVPLPMPFSRLAITAAVVGGINVNDRYMPVSLHNT